MGGTEEGLRIGHEFTNPGQAQPEYLGTEQVNIMDLAGGSVDTLSALGSGIVNVFSFAGGVKDFIQSKGKAGIGKMLDAAWSFLGTIAKGAKGVVGIVRGTMSKGAAGTGVLKIVKEVLGPIPDLLQAIGSGVKTVYYAVTKKGKETAEAAWDTAKSTVNTITGTVKTVFGLVSSLGNAVPIVGSIAKGISAIMGMAEAGVQFILKLKAVAKMKRMISQLTLKLNPFNRTGLSPEEQKKKDRLGYLKDVNRKKLKNLWRQVASHVMGFVGDIVKLAGSVTSLVAEIVSLAGVTAPAAAVAKAFGLFLDIFGSVLKFIGSLITFLPKAAHTVRQWGRNLAAKSGFLGKIARGLGFDPEKSSQKKHEKRKEVVTGLLAEAGGLRTEFSPAGKDKDALMNEVNGEVKKYEDLDFELEATGADKQELYDLNSEPPDQRVEKQAKMLYDALKERD